MAKISFVLLLSGLMLASCQQKESKKTVTEEASINAENQEVTAVVYYFHGTRRCPTCIKVGEIARATVENNFKKKLKKESLSLKILMWKMGNMMIWLKSIKSGGMH